MARKYMKATKVILCLLTAAALLLSPALCVPPVLAASPAVADASQMTTVEEVGEAWMKPVHAESLLDGEYPVEVESSSSMFRIDSAVLRVEEGRLEAKLTMGGKGYLRVWPGSAEEAAEADEDACIPYTEDEEGRHVFTIPVQALDEGFPCAAFSKNKELWYDRTLLLRSDSDASSYRIMSTSGSLNSLQDVSEFTASTLNMDGNSVFCTSLNSNDAYYSFGGKVYRWGMTGAPAGNAAITLPDGEQICDMATNFTNSVVPGSETFLYIATYNPERQGLKGSVFVYDIATDSLVKSYEGVTGKPVKMLYKYRIS